MSAIKETEIKVKATRRVQKDVGKFIAMTKKVAEYFDDKLRRFKHANVGYNKHQFNTEIIDVILVGDEVFVVKKDRIKKFKKCVSKLFLCSQKLFFLIFMFAKNIITKKSKKL